MAWNLPSTVRSQSWCWKGQRMCGKGACKHSHLGDTGSAPDPQPGQQSTQPLPLHQTPLDPRPLPKQFVSMEEGLCCVRWLSKPANLHCSKERPIVEILALSRLPEKPGSRRRDVADSGCSCRGHLDATE